MKKPDFIARQGGWPHGLLGRIVANVMAGETADANDRAISLLDCQPGDTVLDVGTGHGRSLRILADAAHGGKVVGVDQSAVMIANARRRNSKLINAGAIEIVAAPANDLPFEASSFDRALSVHTIYFWEPLGDYLSEIARVLKSGARFVLCFRPAEDAKFGATYPGSIYTIRAQADVMNALALSGFDVMRIEEHADDKQTLNWAVCTRR